MKTLIEMDGKELDEAAELWGVTRRRGTVVFEPDSSLRARIVAARKKARPGGMSEEALWPARMSVQAFNQESESMRIGRKVHESLERQMRESAVAPTPVGEVHHRFMPVQKRACEMLVCKACKQRFDKNVVYAEGAFTGPPLWCHNCAAKRMLNEAGKGIAPKFNYTTPGDQRVPSIVTCDTGADWED